MHLKRNSIGRFWPVPKKGTKYVAVSNHDQKSSIPLVVVMRDILKIVNNKKELKKALNEKQIFINHKQIKETNYPVCLFDTINIPDVKKNYKAILSEQKKIVFEEISDKEAETGVFKVISKKLLSNKKVQLNLSYGRNIISKEKIDAGDSVVLNFKENKLVKIIPMKEGISAFVIKGKHAGSKGKIEEIMVRGGKKLAKIIIAGAGKDESLGQDKINVWTKNIIAME